jgi:hypothetical protein
VHLTLSQQVSSVPAPHELPSAVFRFTDRTTQLAALDRLLAVAEKSPSAGSAVIFAVSGTARGWQDRVRHPLGAPDQESLPRRGALREPARIWA